MTQCLDEWPKGRGVKIAHSAFFLGKKLFYRRKKNILEESQKAPNVAIPHKIRKIGANSFSYPRKKAGIQKEGDQRGLRDDASPHPRS
jgi:hypothetical protein